MRILFVATRAWPAIGGAEMLMRHVSDALAVDHEVSVLALRTDEGPATRLSNGLTLPPPFDPFEENGVRYSPLVLSGRHRAALLPLGLQVTPGTRRYAFGRARRSAAAVYAAVVGRVIAEQAAGADIVHTWSTDLLGAAGVRAAAIAGARSVVTPFLHVGQWGEDPASVQVYKDTDRVIALLETEKTSLAGLGAPREKVGVCGACTPGLETGGGARIRESHRIGGALVVFVGVRRPYKGADILQAALPHLRELVPDATIAFVGPGEPVHSSPGSGVVDAGAVDPEDLAAWMDAADLLCLPSAHEIYPTSILEAWSIGTPVVTSDILTLTELMTQSGGGVAVPRDAATLGKALGRLLSDPTRLADLGARGQAFWRANGTPASVAACHVRQYEEVLSADSGHQLVA
jgi:glycosyltransferase involved in cell wall biosynthesis